MTRHRSIPLGGGLLDPPGVRIGVARIRAGFPLALRAATAPGAALLTDHARAAVLGAVAAWDGHHPPPSTGWLDRPLSDLPTNDLAAARLALLAALAPYRITDTHVAEYRSTHPADADLVRLLAWGAHSAVHRVETWITENSPTGMAPGDASP